MTVETKILCGILLLVLIAPAASATRAQLRPRRRLRGNQLRAGCDRIYARCYRTAGLRLSQLPWCNHDDRWNRYRRRGGTNSAGSGSCLALVVASIGCWLHPLHPGAPTPQCATWLSPCGVKNTGLRRRKMAAPVRRIHSYHRNLNPPLPHLKMYP